MVAYIWGDFALGDFGLETFAKGLTTGKAYVWWLMTRKFKIQGVCPGVYIQGLISQAFLLGALVWGGLC